MSEDTRTAAPFDVLTVLGIGAVVYLIKNLVHEAVGHGGGCLLVGGKAVGLSSAWWDGSYEGVSDWARRFVRAGGTLANLGLGVVLLPMWRWVSLSARSDLRVFVWLLIVVNLFNGGGYLLADPIGNFGDWSAFIEGLEATWVWRVALTSLGALISAATLRFALRSIEIFLGSHADGRQRRVRWLCWGPYVIGGTMFTLAGLLNPLGPHFAFTSALATLGGGAFLAWLPSWVKTPTLAPVTTEVALNRSLGWLVAGVAAVLVTIGVLGPAISFAP